MRAEYRNSKSVTYSLLTHYLLKKIDLEMLPHLKSLEISIKGGGGKPIPHFFNLKMHFRLFKAILDHVFLHLRGGAIFFSTLRGGGRGGLCKNVEISSLF